MKTTTKYVLAYSLWLMTYGLQAQDYQWQWAKHGGGSAKVTNEGGGGILMTEQNISEI